jgi:hypothetical protein
MTLANRPFGAPWQAAISSKTPAHSCSDSSAHSWRRLVPEFVERESESFLCLRLCEPWWHNCSLCCCQSLQHVGTGCIFVQRAENGFKLTNDFLGSVNEI